jgi:tyrosine-protein kinase
VTWQAAARAIWRYKWVAAGLTALLMLLTWALVGRQPNEYQASTKVRIQAIVPRTDAPAIDVDKQNVASYAEIVNGSQFATISAEKLAGLVPPAVPPITPAEIEDAVSAKPVEGTDLLQVNATGRDPGRLADIANVALLTLRQYSRENGARERISPVDEAEVPTSPIAPKVGLAVAIAAIVGLIANGVLMVLLDLFRDRFASPEELEAATGRPLLAVVPRLSRAPAAARMSAPPVQRRREPAAPPEGAKGTPR